MTTQPIGRWLLVTLAIIAIAVAVPLASAHGNDTAANETAPYNGTADDWAAWMEAHMADHMGPGVVDWMEAHMGISVEQMAEHMADDDGDHPGYGMHGGYGMGHGTGYGMGPGIGYGMGPGAGYGMGHGC